MFKILLGEQRLNAYDFFILLKEIEKMVIERPITFNSNNLEEPIPLIQ